MLNIFIHLVVIKAEGNWPTQANLCQIIFRGIIQLSESGLIHWLRAVMVSAKKILREVISTPFGGIAEYQVIQQIVKSVILICQEMWILQGNIQVVKIFMISYLIYAKTVSWNLRFFILILKNFLV